MGWTIEEKQSKHKFTENKIYDISKTGKSRNKDCTTKIEQVSNFKYLGAWLNQEGRIIFATADPQLNVYHSNINNLTFAALKIRVLPQVMLK
jgi:hypothetical protein